MSVKKDVPDTRGRRWNSYLTWLNILGAERRSDRRRRPLIPLFGPSFVGSSCILITCYTRQFPWRRRIVSVIILCLPILSSRCSQMRLEGVWSSTFYSSAKFSVYIEIFCRDSNFFFSKYVGGRTGRYISRLKHVPLYADRFSFQ